MGGLNGWNLPPQGKQMGTWDQGNILSLVLIKILKHGRAGVPMKVTDMLGEFMDYFTANFVDVFTMPLSGTGVSDKAFNL